VLGLCEACRFRFQQKEHGELACTFITIEFAWSVRICAIGTMACGRKVVAERLISRLPILIILPGLKSNLDTVPSRKSSTYFGAVAAGETAAAVEGLPKTACVGAATAGDVAEAVAAAGAMAPIPTAVLTAGGIVVKGSGFSCSALVGCLSYSWTYTMSPFDHRTFSSAGVLGTERFPNFWAHTARQMICKI